MPDERKPPTYFGAPPRALMLGTSLVGRGAARARMFAGFAVRTASAWARAAGQLVALRRERRRVERSRAKLQYELGGAVLAEDGQLVEDLRTRLRACVEERERIDRDAGTVLARAQSRTSEERSAVARTEIRRAGEMGDPGFEPGTSALSERRSNQLS
jgi:hypothetical protein